MSMFRLEITIDDLALLSEDDFWLVWTQLGVLVRAKGIFQREGPETGGGTTRTTAVLPTQANRQEPAPI